MNDIARKKPVYRGRGAPTNPSGRFESHNRVRSGDDLDVYLSLEEQEDGLRIETEILPDTSRTIISTNDSPDIGMDTTVNPYRGCEHGCIYCYARPYHEFLGLSAGVDFETKIFAKYDAAALLREKLSHKNWQPRCVTFSGVTDCYQPLEKKLRLTRACLEVLNEFRNPASIITKNALVTRDIDLYAEMAARQGIAIHISVTSLDGDLSRKMEPRASQPKNRLKAIEALAARNVPVSVIIGPVLPGLTDHEIPAILKAAADAGASGAHYTMLRLPYGVKDLFVGWLEQHYPDRAAKVLSHVRGVRDGKLNSAEFGTRMRGTGVYADQIAATFTLYRKKYGLNRRYDSLSSDHFRRVDPAGQGDLFSL